MQGLISTAVKEGFLSVGEWKLSDGNGNHRLDPHRIDPSLMRVNLKADPRRQPTAPSRINGRCILIPCPAVPELYGSISPCCSEQLASCSCPSISGAEASNTGVFPGVSIRNQSIGQKFQCLAIKAPERVIG